MQKLYTPLKTALWSFIGVFLGAALFRYGDWRTHPGLYVSTPWYAGLLPLVEHLLVRVQTSLTLSLTGLRRHANPFQLALQCLAALKIGRAHV